MANNRKAPLMIGVSGHKRVGKDTFARMLHAELANARMMVYRTAFADEMKAAARDLFGFAGLKSGGYYEAHPEEKETVLPRIGRSPRGVWIDFANAVRAIHADAWVNMAFRPYLCAHADAVVFTDVRFRNEADAIRERGGLIVRLHRAGAPRGDDPAEVDLENYPAFYRHINNDGSLEELRAAARALASVLIPGLAAGQPHGRTDGQGTA